MVPGGRPVVSRSIRRAGVRSWAGVGSRVSMKTKDPQGSPSPSRGPVREGLRPPRRGFMDVEEDDIYYLFSQRHLECCLI